MLNDILSTIDEKAIISFLRDFININTENPPGNETAGAEFLGKKLEEIGCKVEYQEAAPGRLNVLGTIEGNSPEKLLFNGHVDTVAIGNTEKWEFPPLGGDIKDGYMYGRGAADMKSGLVSMIFAVEALIKSGLPMKKGLLFTGVIDEEFGFKGTQALLDDGKLESCTMGFVSEPTNLEIATRLKGGIEYSAKTFGINAHTGQAYLGENAIYRMGGLIRRLEEYNSELKKRIYDIQLKHPTCTVGTIKGGTGVTFVPDLCEISFDRQVFPTEDLDQIRCEVREIVKEYGEKKAIDIELNENISFPPWEIGHDEPVVQLLDCSIQNVLDRKPEFGILNGYAEVEMLHSAGIPSVLFGPGDDNTSHTYNERVSIQEVVDAAKVYAELAKCFCCD